MKKVMYVFLAIITIMLICIFLNKTQIVSNTNVKINEKICWGLKRENNHIQPTFYKPHTDVLDKYNGIYVGNNEEKSIYLTFDEGYENGYTAQILDVLKENNVKAAFFITSDYLKTSEDLVQRIINEGHILGNHTHTHPSLPTLYNKEKIKNELLILENEVFNRYGYKMSFFRPPMGEYSQFTMECINELGYTSVMWSFAYDDWNTKTLKGEEYAKDKILSNLHNGEIMLLHAVSKDNANVLDYVIKEAIKQGYEFKSLNDFKR